MIISLSEKPKLTISLTHTKIRQTTIKTNSTFPSSVVVFFCFKVYLINFVPVKHIKNNFIAISMDLLRQRYCCRSGLL